MISKTDAEWIFSQLAEIVADSSLVRHSGDRLDHTLAQAAVEVNFGKRLPPNPARKTKAKA